MELWQLDIVGGIQLTDGGEAKAVTGVDDHSRFCVIATVVRTATGRARVELRYRAVLAVQSGDRVVEVAHQLGVSP